MAEQSQSLGVAPNQVAGSTMKLGCCAIQVEARTDTTSNASERLTTTKPILEDPSRRTELPLAVDISSSRIISLPLPGQTKDFHPSTIPHQAQQAEHHADLVGSSNRDYLCQYHSEIIQVASAVDIAPPTRRITSLPGLTKVFNSSIFPRSTKSTEFHIRLCRYPDQDNSLLPFKLNYRALEFKDSDHTVPVPRSKLSDSTYTNVKLESYKMSAPRNTPEFISEGSTVDITKDDFDRSETAFAGSETQSVSSRLSSTFEFEEELKKYATGFLEDDYDDELMETKQELKDEEIKPDGNKNKQEEGEEYNSDSTSSISSVSSSEFRPKSKKRPCLMLNPQAAWEEARSMTIAEMQEAMDADLDDEPFDRSNWKPPKSIMERVAKRQRKERKAAERASRRAARAAARGEAEKEKEKKKKQERWAPY